MDENEIKTAKRLQRAQSLVGASAGRPEHDWYASPPEAARALLEVEEFQGDIWEPACGNGAISKVFESHGRIVRSTDLIYRGYGERKPIDFLLSFDTATNIVTNPPYNLAERFVDKALSLTSGKVCMLLKLQFLEGAKRKSMFTQTPLARVHVFSKRLSMYRNAEQGNYASGMIAFAWFTWQHGHKGPPTLGWI